MIKPPWLVRAIGELGVAELPGEESNLRILEYDLETTLKATSDEVPWCSAFLCWCFEREGIPSTRSAAAKSWLDWGVSISKPIQGAVVVLSRGENTLQGHVGLYWSEDMDQIYILGGNQDNKVCVKGFKKEHILGYRLPEDDYWIGEHAAPQCHTSNS